MTPEEEKAKQIEEAVRACEAKKDGAAEGDLTDTPAVNVSMNRFINCIEAFGKRLDALEGRSVVSHGRPFSDEGGEEGGRPVRVKHEPEPPMNEPDGADMPPDDDRDGNANQPGTPRPVVADSWRPGSPDHVRYLNALAQTQGRADQVACAFGRQAPPPMSSEALGAYRRRMLQPYLAYSKDWKGVDVHKVRDARVFAAMEKQVYADALQTVAANPGHALGARPGQIIPRVKVNPETGLRTTEFFSSDGRTMFHQMGRAPRRVARFMDHGGNKNN